MNFPASAFPVPNTVITSAVDTPAANGLPQRCIVNGVVNQRISPVDHCQYVNGFQFSLPLMERTFFMFQGSSSTEGSVPAATGSTLNTASTFRDRQRLRWRAKMAAISTPISQRQAMIGVRKC